jgi:nickel-dependent lactate racemase
LIAITEANISELVDQGEKWTMNTINVPQLAWFGAKGLNLLVPDDWQIQICNMQGYQRKPLNGAEISASLKSPIDSQSISIMARGKKEVVIVFDDLTRVTRTVDIIQHVLQELFEAGIQDENIRFICGLGLHGILSRSDMVKKLGEETVSRFRVYNHNAFGNCSYCGTTQTHQTKVYINEEYLKCDFKIVIGSCVPHGVAGFGGGGKLVMPGLASFETINQHHKAGGARMDPLDLLSKPTQGMAMVENNLFRKDLDQAAELAGIDFLINTTVNLWGESVALFCGNWKAAYAAAVKDALVNYRTPAIKDMDIVIANSYAKASESMISLAAAIPLVSTCGGDIVLIANAPEGQVIHYLVGMFGKETYACQYTQCEIPDNINQVIVYNEYPHRGSGWFKEHPKIKYCRSWEDVIKLLNYTRGSEPRVAVIPDATNQYFDWYHQ